MDSKRRHPSDDDDDVDHNNRPADLREKKRKMPHPSDNVNDNAETDRAGLNSCEVDGQHPSDDVNNNYPPAGSGLAMVNAYEWRDIAQSLNFHDNTILRFASGALNRLIFSSSSTLPLRVIAGLVAGRTDEGYRATGFEADLRTPLRDLVSDVHASPESMLHDALSRCEGLVVTQLELHDLHYDDKVVEALTQRLTSVTVSELIFDGVASGHDRVHRLVEIAPGLRAASFKNDAAHPNAAAFLGVCAARRIPNATLNFAADVTDAQIIEYLFSANSPKTTRQFGVPCLRRSLSENFFGMIVECCRRSFANSLRFGIAGILTDPSDAKFEQFMVERNDDAAMYRFPKEDSTEASFTILVGMNTTTKRFYLRVFQGDFDDLCTSLAAAKKIPTCRLSRT